MSPSADTLRSSSTASRRVIVPLGGGSGGGGPPPMALQRSEFEDFVNAYRPSSDAPKKDIAEPPPPKSKSSEDSKVDFGKSLKRLMKKAPTSPNVTSKTQKKETSQRLPPERDKNVIGNELKPPSTSQVKKASKPGGVAGAAHPVTLAVPDASSSAQPSTFQQRSIVSQHPVTIPVDPKAQQQQQQQQLHTVSRLENPSKNGTSVKAKSDRGSSQDNHQKLPPVPPQADVVMVPQVLTPVRPPSPCPVPKVSIQELPKDMQKVVSSSSQPSTPTERDTHCIVLQRNIVDRFQPPRKNQDPLWNMRVVEVPDRKYRVIMEFEESLIYQKPCYSPSGLFVIQPDTRQSSKNYWDQLEAFNWTKQSKVAASGMLLANVEKLSEFPYVTYLVVGGGRSEFIQKVNLVRGRPLPAEHNHLHFVAGYEEAVSVCRPPIPAIPDKPSSNKCGYVISLYQVLPGDDRQRFEQNWVTWTGARLLYINAPEYMGFKSMSLYKSVLPTEVIIYVLVCELSAIMDHLTEACELVDRLRARCCGFTGIYRVLDVL